MIRWRTSTDSGCKWIVGHFLRRSSVYVLCILDSSNSPSGLDPNCSSSTVDTIILTPWGSWDGSQCKVFAVLDSPRRQLTASRTITMRAGNCFFPAAARNRLSDHLRRSSDVGISISLSWKCSFKADSSRWRRWASCFDCGEHPTKCWNRNSSLCFVFLRRLTQFANKALLPHPAAPVITNGSLTSPSIVSAWLSRAWNTALFPVS